MIKPGLLSKYPSEVITIQVDLTDVAEGLTISSASIAVKDRNGTDVTSSMINSQSYSSNVLTATVKNGQALADYFGWITANFSDGQKTVLPLLIKVKEGP